MNKAFRFRIYPAAEQVIMIRKTFGCVRFLYNQMLAERKDRMELFPNSKDLLMQQRYLTPANFKTG